MVIKNGVILELYIIKIGSIFVIRINGGVVKHHHLKHIIILVNWLQNGTNIRGMVKFMKADNNIPTGKTFKEAFNNSISNIKGQYQRYGFFDYELFDTKLPNR